MKFFLDTTHTQFDLNLKMIGLAKEAYDRFTDNVGTNQEYATAAVRIRRLPVILKMNPRLRRSAGIARFFGSKNDINGLSIDLNPLISQLKQKTIYDVVSHEVAHCIDFIIRGNSFHDVEWQAIHKSMGGTGNTGIKNN